MVCVKNAGIPTNPPIGQKSTECLFQAYFQDNLGLLFSCPVGLLGASCALLLYVGPVNLQGLPSHAGERHFSNWVHGWASLGQEAYGL